ncbi:hypothetical protein [Ferviditalea candida]|uniref:Uncharacterized protein n=1 Tax=Ferviditalea candida TaxID=3108399 RepID=A0ABU5ZCR1_9BACL|nr:hypothetical protein [Paenibacillaceae bacterium T2]
MFGLLKRKNPAAGSTEHEIQRKLEKIEKTLEQMRNGTTEYHIKVEHLHVDRPVLENLIFRMDQLDIDELSGSLNLGNNFGTPGMELFSKDEKGGRERMPGATANAGKSPKDQKQSEQSGLKQTQTGYRYRL